MYCPNCASENSEEQRFCRTCGLHLQTISQVVSHQIRSIQKTDSAIKAFCEPKNIWQNPLLYGFFLVLMGLLVVTIGKKIIGEQLIADIGTLISLSGIAVFILKGVFLVQRSQRSGSTEPTPDFTRADTTTELPHLIEAKEPPSVTEFTTRNFDPVYVERHNAESSTSHRNSRS
jgi:hypothetical protein